MDFVATMDFKSPYVVTTGVPHRPTQIKAKKFKKGEIICGELKESKGKPAFVLHRGVIVVPLECVKKVIVKDVVVNEAPKVSSAEGSGNGSGKINIEKKSFLNDGKKKFFDAMIIGGVAGFGGVYFAEKKGWIAEPSKKNKLIGVVAGALLGAYLVYRFQK